MKYTTKLKAGSFLLSSLLLASAPLYASDAKSNSRILPIWGDEARAMGYELPEPFGVSASYMTMKQDIKVKEINFTNLEFVASALEDGHKVVINTMIDDMVTDIFLPQLQSLMLNGELGNALGNLYEQGYLDDVDQIDQSTIDMLNKFTVKLILKNIAKQDKDKFDNFMKTILEGYDIKLDIDSIAGMLPSGGNIPLPQTLFDIEVGHTKQKSHTENIRLDTWILPFMNIYGILGQTKGHSISKVNVKTNFNQFIDPNVVNDFINSGLITDQTIPSMLGKIDDAIGANLHDIDFRLDFKGKTYGGGMTLAGGTGNFFALLDANYTWTRFDVLDGNIKAFTIAPRIGYRFTTPSWEAINLKPGKLNVWVGSMYQDIQQDFRGSLDNLRMPPELTQLIAMADGNHNGRFQVKQELKKPWNILLGARYEMTPNFALTTELGFEDRKSFFVSGEFRF